MHGGVDRSALSVPDVAAVERGLENLGRHIRNTGQYGVPLAVAINRFSSDTQAEIDVIKAYVEQHGARARRRRRRARKKAEKANASN